MLEVCVLNPPHFYISYHVEHKVRIILYLIEQSEVRRTR